MDRWNPIDTAPKDGSWIVVTSAHNHYYRAAVQYECGQWIDVNEAVHNRYMQDAATHWMQLPEPPVR